MHTLELSNIKTYSKSTNSILDFYNNFDSVRCYHACRTPNIEEYFEHGIKSFTFDSLLNHIYNIFDIQKGDFRFDDLLEITKEKYYESDNSHVYFHMNKNELLKTSKHYLNKGSELVQSIAVNFEKGSYGELNSKLSNYGKAYVLTCEIPLEEVEACFLNDLRRRIIENEISPNSDISIRVKKRLDKKYIVNAESISV